MFESSELQLSAFGEIAEDGTYRLSTHSVDDGAPVGSYVVTIQGAMQPDTRSYEEQTEGVGTPPQPLIHSKYTAAATSDLKAEVTSGKNVLDFVVDPPQ